MNDLSGFIQHVSLTDCIPGLLHAFSPTLIDDKYCWVRNDNCTIEWYDTPDLYLKSQSYFVCASLELYIYPQMFKSYVRHSFDNLNLN